VQAWLDSQTPRGKGLAVFSCGPRGLWRVEFFAVRVMDHLAFEDKPDVAPLLRLLDEYERYAVALVDRERARLFVVFAGEIEAAQDFRDHGLAAVSARRDERHHEAHVYEHLKRVAQRLVELYRRRRFDRLILAGPEEATSELRRVLPRALAHRVVATIPAEIDAGEREILDRTLGIERLVERDAEERLLQQLLDLAGPGGRAVLGVRPTLAALWADLVQTLVVAQSAGGDGSDCPNCQRLEPGRVERCPACASPMRPVHDVFHRAMERTVEQSGSVEVVLGDAERRLLELGGGLGALLRYPSPVPQAVR
jgi:peptide subunit release factor 1 (eRF1)